MVSREEFLRHPAHAPELDDLGDDDRPAKQRDNDKYADGDLAFNCCLLERELQRAGGEHGSQG